MQDLGEQGYWIINVMYTKFFFPFLLQFTVINLFKKKKSDRTLAAWRHRVSCQRNANLKCGETLQLILLIFSRLCALNVNFYNNVVMWCLMNFDYSLCVWGNRIQCTLPSTAPNENIKIYSHTHLYSCHSLAFLRFEI